MVSARVKGAESGNIKQRNIVNAPIAEESEYQITTRQQSSKCNPIARDLGSFFAKISGIRPPVLSDDDGYLLYI